MGNTGTSTANFSTSLTHLTSSTLQGWKEIAAYLKRGTRTVQRWEQFAGLPVRRPRDGDRSPVFAFPDEIDKWLHSRPKRNNDSPFVPPDNNS